MFEYKSLEKQLIDERKKNTVLKAQNDRNVADIDYIAMMTDVELDEPEEMEEDNSEW